MFPKVRKRVLNMFCGNFSGKFFFAQCSMEGRFFEMFSKNQKLFKIPKMPKIVPKRPNAFWTSFGVIFSKNFFAQCSMEGRVFENFQNSKNAQNRSRKYPNAFWTCFGVIFSKFFLPSVPWRVESSKCFQKIKISEFQNLGYFFKTFFAQCSMEGLRKIFSKIFFAQCSMEGRVFEMF